MDFHPGDGVFRGIEIGRAPQHLGGDAILANLFVITLEVLGADVFEQFDQPLGARESGRRENRRQFQAFRTDNSGGASFPKVSIPHLW